jgi:hypothetical protein
MPTKTEKINKLVAEINKLEDNDVDNLLKIFNFELKNTIHRRDLFLKGNKKHPVVLLKDDDDEMIEIDKNISELIEILWKLEIRTCNSCQNNIPKDYIWIEFFDYISMMNFMDTIIENTPTNQHKRILYMQRHEKNSWIKDINFTDTTILHDEDDSVISNETINLLPCCFSIRFPKSDYKMVLNIFKEKLITN